LLDRAAVAAAAATLSATGSVVSTRSSKRRLTVPRRRVLKVGSGLAA
jgi:hypothetical protein